MEIRQEVNEILHRQFKLPYGRLVPEAHLYADLQLDSLDAADLLVLLEERTRRTILPETFMEARTLEDVYQVVASLVDPAEREGEIDRNAAVGRPPLASE